MAQGNLNPTTFSVCEDSFMIFSQLFCYWCYWMSLGSYYLVCCDIHSVVVAGMDRYKKGTITSTSTSSQSILQHNQSNQLTPNQQYAPQNPHSPRNRNPPSPNHLRLPRPPSQPTNPRPPQVVRKNAPKPLRRWFQKPHHWLWPSLSGPGMH